MSTKLTIRGTSYNFPSPDENPNWAEELTAWATAVTDTLELVLSSGDILQTSFLITNNQSTTEVIRGLFLNPLEVRAAIVNYSVYRTTDSTSVVETGEMLVTFDGNATAGSKWKLIHNVNGDAGVILSVEDTGQFYYKSSNLSGTNYAGKMKFFVKTLGV